MPNNEAPAPTISVMLVDDSAVIRGALMRLLEDDPAIKIVASVNNGELAVQAASQHKPDIVILDIEMPVMDGITALPYILKKSPASKVIMFSTLTEKGAVITLKAYALGAVECLVKPSAGEAQKGGAFHQNLLALIKSLRPKRQALPPPATSRNLGSMKAEQTTAKTGTPAVAQAKQSTSFSLRSPLGLYMGKPQILAIGSSTGGPQALFEVLKNCAGLPIPIVITQHMPSKFTAILAEHIQQKSGIPTFEGAEGMVVEPGKAYVAPGGFHMLFEKQGLHTRIRLNDGPPVNYCKPAVDPMLASLLPLYGNKILCVILTGMGQDGIGGGKALSEKGGKIIAQDEATSVVWGMPGAVATAGVCTEVLPLKEIGPAIKKTVTGMV